MNRKPEYWADEGEFQLTWIEEESEDEIVVKTSPRHLDGHRVYRFSKITEDVVAEQDYTTPHVRRFISKEEYEVLAHRITTTQTTLQDYERPQQHATG